VRIDHNILCFSSVQQPPAMQTAAASSRHKKSHPQVACRPRKHGATRSKKLQMGIGHGARVAPSKEPTTGTQA
jgi:hypothetical protein